MQPSVLLIPGLWSSGPQHWQTHWEAKHPDWRRVQQRDFNRAALIAATASVRSHSSFSLRCCFASSAVTKAAAARNVEVSPVRWKRDGLKLGFAAVDAREIRRGVRELANAIASARVLKKR
jgi:DNA-binding transcriptional MocR family regulator